MEFRYVCGACGHATTAGTLPLRCPNAIDGDDLDHLLAREASPGALKFPVEDPADPNPFVRYRELMWPWNAARAGGMSDAEFVSLVHDLDARVGEVEGRAHGFRTTPLRHDAELAIWAKDETGNVSGSHKARHLFGVLLGIEVAARIAVGSGQGDDANRPLAIASCGNAALAAAVVARAARRRLRVFIPTDANPNVVARLHALDAAVEICPRQDGVPGDPTYLRFQQAVKDGALPFCCQGPDCGLTIDGGRTLAYELVDQLRASDTALDHFVVQVGGGALGSACAQALAECVQLGVLKTLPRVHFVQTESCFPLRRAYEVLQNDLHAALAATGDPEAPSSVAEAAHPRSRYMRPWDTAPHSVAHGIVDDETYDWRALCDAMLASGGQPVVVDEDTLIEANREVARTRPAGLRAVDETGTSGYAGVIALRRLGVIRSSDRVGVILSGARR